MRFQRLRRVLLAAACLASLLTACGGGGEVVSKFNATRMITFGDGFSDIGQRGGLQYTVNGGQSNWTQFMASRLGLRLTKSTAGGTSYAFGSARVVATPDAAGDATTPTVEAQVTAFLSAGAPRDGDLVVISAGMSDVIAELAKEMAGTQTAEATAANVTAAGRALGDQVRRLVKAGATHVIVAGMYNLGRSPWATGLNRAAQLQDLSSKFNNGLLVSIVDLGGSTLYFDTALFFNLVTASPATYGLRDVTSTLCTSVDPTNSLGIGANQVSSLACTVTTLNSSLGVETTLFADPVYFTPGGNALLGTTVADRVHTRF